MFIKTPEDLTRAITIAENTTGEKRNEAIEAIGTYKWYNYYCNIHIKKDSEADKENEKIFKYLEKESPEIHKLVEQRVDMYIGCLEHDLD